MTTYGRGVPCGARVQKHRPPATEASSVTSASFMLSTFRRLYPGTLDGFGNFGFKFALEIVDYRLCLGIKCRAHICLSGLFYRAELLHNRLDRIPLAALCRTHVDFSETLANSLGPSRITHRLNGLAFLPSGPHYGSELRLAQIVIDLAAQNDAASQFPGIDRS